MVGDTSFDIGCGQGAGVDTVFVGWSVSTLEKIEADGYKPEYVIEKPMDLFEIIEETHR